MSASEVAAPKWMKWAGFVLTAIPVLMMGLSGTMKLVGPAEVARDFVGKAGFPASTLVPIGLLELGCVILYLVPRTAVLGAVLVTGYLGGAVVTHVRIGDAPGAVAPALLGVLAWGGLYLRDARIRALLPLRRSP
jgi:hypothetical protein